MNEKTIREFLHEDRKETLVTFFKIITFSIAQEVVKNSSNNPSKRSELSYEEFCGNVILRIQAIIQDGQKENQELARRIQDTFIQYPEKKEQVLSVFFSLHQDYVIDMYLGKEQEIEVSTIPEVTVY